jgi:hypothetical protein
MAAMDNQSLKPTKEQIIYANLLLMGMVTGIIIMIITYTIYVTGLLPSHVDMQSYPPTGERVSMNISKLPIRPTDGVAHLLGKGDFLNYIGFTLLGVLTIICYLVLVRGYYRQKNWIFARPSVFWKLPFCPWRHQEFWAAAGIEQRPVSKTRIPPSHNQR